MKMRLVMHVQRFFIITYNYLTFVFTLTNNNNHILTINIATLLSYLLFYIIFIITKLGQNRTIKYL